MSKSKSKIRFDYRHIICIGITLFFIALSVLLFPTAFLRVGESLRDLINSVRYYFNVILCFGKDVPITVNTLPSGKITLPFIPLTFSEFKVVWRNYWKLWASKNNLLNYLKALGVFFVKASHVILILAVLFIVLTVLFKLQLKNENNDYDKDSKALKVFKNVTRVTYIPVKKWLIGFVEFVKEHKAYKIIWAVIWLYNFNAFTIAIEAIAFILYFCVSFDVVNIYRQVYKLFIDLSNVTNFVPLWAWILIGLLGFDKMRKGIALKRLNHLERKNRGFINARPIVFMVCGTMGKKKTTAITDMALSQEVMLRDKAFEKILENDLKFPFFPWINLENEIKRGMEYHEIYNLATVRRFVRKKYERWCKSNYSTVKLFNYDYIRYGLSYDDKLKVVSVWEVIENYAQLYFIYTIQSSLLISNYSVRVDNVLMDLGNFPMWNTGFFSRDSRLLESYSRHAHILDFDALRLGRKVVENNEKANSFDFGVVLITEVGKERCNNLELSEKKKSSDTTNQKNDLFNSWLKMVRHSATVDNFPFVRVITDEQRPESWGADARDLCEIVRIEESDETTLAMPFFSLGELLYGWLFGKFSSVYSQYRFKRSDNVLSMYIIKKLTAKLQDYYTGIYNRFGLCRLHVSVESGTQDGKKENNYYYLISKKIYSRRFSTDCFSDFFAEKALRSSIGINDLREYYTEKATFEELSEQNSYFINDLLNGLKNGKK